MQFEWRTVNLGSVAEISSEKVLINELNEAQYISTDNMLNNMGGVESAVKLPNVKSVVSFNEGDVLFSNIRTYFKKVWPASFSGGCSADVLVWRPKGENIIDKNFLFYVLSSDAFTQYSVKTSKGVKMPRGDKKALLEFEFELPPLETQLQIVQSINPINRKIELNTKMNQTLEKIAQRIFKSWFIDFDPVKANAEGLPFAGLSPDIQSLFPKEFVESKMGLIPKGWEVKPLSDFSGVVSKGTTPTKADMAAATDTSDIQYLKVRDISDDGLISAELDKIPRSIHETKLKRSILKKNDLIVSIAGTIGRVTVIPDWLDDSNCNQAVCFVRLKSDSDYQNYLNILLKQKTTQEYFRENVVQGVQANISLAVVKNTSVLSPTDEIIDAFNECVGALIERINLNKSQNIRLKKIRDKLLPKLLSGSIEIKQELEKLDEAS